MAIEPLVFFNISGLKSLCSQVLLVESRLVLLAPSGLHSYQKEEADEGKMKGK